MTVNPFIWHGTRELTVIPPHFIKCPTEVTDTNKYWIQNNASGRYAFAKSAMNAQYILDLNESVYFENNQDAIMYELMWSCS